MHALKTLAGLIVAAIPAFGCSGQEDTTVTIDDLSRVEVIDYPDGFTMVDDGVEIYDSRDPVAKNYVSPENWGSSLSNGVCPATQNSFNNQVQCIFPDDVDAIRVTFDIEHMSTVEIDAAIDAMNWYESVTHYRFQTVAWPGIDENSKGEVTLYNNFINIAFRGLTPASWITAGAMGSYSCGNVFWYNSNMISQFGIPVGPAKYCVFGWLGFNEDNPVVWDLKQRAIQGGAYCEWFNLYKHEIGHAVGLGHHSAGFMTNYRSQFSNCDLGLSSGQLNRLNAVNEGGNLQGTHIRLGPAQNDAAN